MNIQISKIQIKERKRAVDFEKVNILAESIRMSGLLHPIVINKEFYLISGLHRLEAFKLLGKEVIPCTIKDIDNLKAELLEIDENLIRNELTVLERSQQLTRRKEIYEILYPDSKQYSSHKQRAKHYPNEIISPGFSKTTATLAGVSKRTIQQELQIAKNIDKEVQALVSITPLADNKNELLRLARMDTEEQKRIIQPIIKGVAKNITESKQELFKTEKVYQELPEGVFQVIYADPPWKYEHGGVSPYNSVEFQYPVMELEQIKSLHIPADKDAVLFLWATAPKLQEALEVLNSWGFTYKTCGIWNKKAIGLGYYFRNQHELLLIGIKGNIRKPFPTDRVSSVYEEIRKGHSRKPDYYYELIERMYPELKKLELFARRLRNGWTSWGNESDVSLNETSNI